MEKVTFLISLEPELKKDLRKIADIEKRTLTSLINKVLSDFSEGYQWKKN